MALSTNTAQQRTATLTSGRAAPALSQGAARLALGAATLFLVFLAVLHVLKPELDPSWRMVSEYEIGRHGWMMMLAFLTLALSCVSLVVALRSHLQTRGGAIGLAALLLTAAGMTIAAIFTADPITARADELTMHGNMHGVGAFIGIPGFLIAATLISRSRGRHPAWSSARGALRWMLGLNWISILLLVVILAVMLPRSGGTLGPDVVIGWPNRLFVIANCGWLMVAAWRAMQWNK